jgi:hypothetical protein
VPPLLLRSSQNLSSSVLRFGFLGTESPGPIANRPIRRRLTPLSRQLAAGASQDVVTLTLQTAPMQYQVSAMIMLMIMADKNDEKRGGGGEVVAVKTMRRPRR